MNSLEMNMFLEEVSSRHSEELISSGLIPRPLGRNIMMKWEKKVNIYIRAIMYRY